MISSKRSALRFLCHHESVKYKTAYNEGEGTLTDISTGGCALGAVTAPLQEEDVVLISIELPDTDKIIEAKSVVMRRDETSFAVKYVLLEETTRLLIRKYFAQRTFSKK